MKSRYTNKKFPYRIMRENVPQFRATVKTVAAQRLFPRNTRSALVPLFRT